MERTADDDTWDDPVDDDATTAEIFDQVRERLLNPAEFPQIKSDASGMFLLTSHGADYDIPEDAAGLLRFFYRMSEKTWFDRRYFRDTLARIADARSIDLNR